MHADFNCTKAAVVFPCNFMLLTFNMVILISPSGCTFWGKKPWSRKKKIFWQLSTLVGAPVGIALIAGIAVPAIVIGVPVWVGRKVSKLFLIHTVWFVKK